MTARHLYTLLCEYAFLAADRKPGFLGVFQNIIIDQVPGSIPQFFVVVGVMADPEDSMEIVIANADRSWQATVHQGKVPEIEEHSDKSKLKAIMFFARVPNLEFPGVGRYQVLIRAGDQVLHSFPFGVSLKKEAKWR